jgi:hypothetical protein
MLSKERFARMGGPTGLFFACVFALLAVGWWYNYLNPQIRSTNSLYFAILYTVCASALFTIVLFARGRRASR